MSVQSCHRGLREGGNWKGLAALKRFKSTRLLIAYGDKDEAGINGDYRPSPIRVPPKLFERPVAFESKHLHVKLHLWLEVPS